MNKKRAAALLLTAAVFAAAILTAVWLKSAPQFDEQGASGSGQVLGYDIAEGIKITRVFSYSGPFVEDGSNEEKSGVLALLVQNTCGEDIQLLSFSLNIGSAEYSFEITTLFDGHAVTVLEKNAAPYADGEITGVQILHNAKFTTPPELYRDELEVQGLGGVLNVTNKTERDIEGDIFIYYKTLYQDNSWLGGITYRTRVSGLKAGELKQSAASHFDAESSKILFITYEQ